MTLRTMILAVLGFGALTLLAADADMPCEKCHGEKQVSVKCRTCTGIGKTYEECRSCEAKGVQVSKCPTCDGIGLVETANCSLCGGKGTLEEDCPTCKGSPKKLVTCSTCNGKREVRDSSSTEANAMMSCGACGGNGKTEEICSKCEGKAKVDKFCRTCEGRGITGKMCSKCRGTKVLEKPCPDCKKGLRELPCRTCDSKGYQAKNCNACGAKGVASPKSLFFPYQTFTIAEGVVSLQKGNGKPGAVATQKSVAPGVFQVLVGTNIMGHYVAGESLKAGEPKVYVTVEKGVKAKPRLDEVKKKWLPFPTVNGALFYLLEK